MRNLQNCKKLEQKVEELKCFVIEIFEEIVQEILEEKGHPGLEIDTATESWNTTLHYALKTVKFPQDFLICDIGTFYWNIYDALDGLADDTAEQIIKEHQEKEVE